MFDIQDYATLIGRYFGLHARVCEFSANNTLAALAAGNLCLTS
mgnify:CR=1 FL=1